MEHDRGHSQDASHHVHAFRSPGQHNPSHGAKLPFMAALGPGPSQFGCVNHNAAVLGSAGDGLPSSSARRRRLVLTIKLGADVTVRADLWQSETSCRAHLCQRVPPLARWTGARTTPAPRGPGLCDRQFIPTRMIATAGPLSRAPLRRHPSGWRISDRFAARACGSRGALGARSSTFAHSATLRLRPLVCAGMKAPRSGGDLTVGASVVRAGRNRGTVAPSATFSHEPVACASGSAG